jgi:hypothetical protein
MAVPAERTIVKSARIAFFMKDYDGRFLFLSNRNKDASSYQIDLSSQSWPSV